MADTIKVSIGAALAAGFRSAFSGAESSVDSLGDKIGSLKSKVGDVSAHRRLQAETLALGESLDEAKKKTAAMREEVAKSTKPTRDQTKALRDAEKEEQRFTDALDKKTQALSISSQNLRTAGVDTRNLVEEEKRLNDELSRQERLRSSMGRLKDHLGISGDNRIVSIGERFQNLRNSATSAFRDISIAGAAAGAGTFMLAKSTADYGDEVAETANYLNISTSALQEYRGVAMRVGVETESMDKALEKFSINLGKAANNGAKGREEFRKMGLNLDQLIKMGPDKAMMRVADAIARMPKHTKQAAAAVEIFGKSGLKMLNVLGGGSKELARMREEVRKTGMVMGPEQLEVAGKFDDAWNGFTQTMLGVRNTVGIALVPAFSDLFGQLSDYVASNGPRIQEFAKSFAEGLVTVAQKIPPLVEGIASIASKLFGMADAAQTALGGWDNLIIALVGARLVPVAINVGKLGFSVIQMASSFRTALVAAGGLFPFLAASFPVLSAGILSVGAALMATPIGWVIGGIALVVGALFMLYKYWDYVWAFCKGFFTGIVESIQPVVESFQPFIDVIKDLGSKFADLFTPVNATTDELAKATSAGIRFGQLVGRALNLTLMPIRLILEGLQKIGELVGMTSSKVDFEEDPEIKANMDQLDARFGKPGLPGAVHSGKGGSVTNNNNNQYHFNIDGSQDPDASARALRQELERIDREKAAGKRSSYSDGGQF